MVFKDTEKRENKKIKNKKKNKLTTMMPYVKIPFFYNSSTVQFYSLFIKFLSICK